MGCVAAGGRSVDLVVPVKPLRVAKSRLRGAFGEDPAQHARLVLALALDTIGAVLAARRVGRLLVMSTDPVVAAGLAAQRVPVVPDGPVPGLNAALEHGAGLLRAGGAAAVGALQADLPALRPGDLDAAIGQARPVAAPARSAPTRPGRARRCSSPPPASRWTRGSGAAPPSATAAPGPSS
jgi:2-phospho-L-lactate/phosphoenolpyruvate guanylyltransferase